jgi:hypothetical protein
MMLIHLHRLEKTFEEVDALVGHQQTADALLDVHSTELTTNQAAKVRLHERIISHVICMASYHYFKFLGFL